MGFIETKERQVRVVTDPASKKKRKERQDKSN